MMKTMAIILVLCLSILPVGGCHLLTRIQDLAEEQKTEGEIQKNDQIAVMATSMPTMEYAFERSAAETLMGGYYYEDEYNTEEYAALKENGFQSVATSPLSTFSADVDTASYCNLRRMIYQGYTAEEIPNGAVRIEEMLNYFRYDHVSPGEGEPFAVTSRIAPCPWHAGHMLLWLGVVSREAERSVYGSNLVFLVDVSGSMASENKLGLLQESLSMLVDQLGENDSVSIVTYASEERIIVEGANPIRNRSELLSAIDGLRAGGSTAGERGLLQAYEVAQRCLRPGGNNRIILCSDGDLNVGISSSSELKELVSEKRETGIYLSVLGFGDGNYKDEKMETIADAGNGNYYYIDSKLESQKVLCEELTQTLFTVADDVKFQVEFNPAYVAAYRQVGYENRQLDDAEFDDDTKDAGEVGSGAMLTVMYELIPSDAEDAPGNALKYQEMIRTERSESDEWLTVSIRYKEPGTEESVLKTFTAGKDNVTEKVSGDLAFACAVAEFGMILGESEYMGDTDYSSVLGLLKEADLNDAYKEEFFSLVKIIERGEKLN